MYNLTLVYQGPLKSNGRAEHKSAIRQEFSAQLKTVYEREILNHESESVRTLVEEKCVREVAGQRYTSLANRTFGLHAKVDVTLLSVNNSSIFANAQGDIDNRLKTLFDALSIPPQSQAEQIRCTAPELIVCLVEDDVLIRDVRVRVGELLLPVQDKSTVVVHINVSLIRHGTIADMLFVAD
jgi:hypothetical protein